MKTMMCALGIALFLLVAGCSRDMAPVSPPDDIQRGPARELTSLEKSLVQSSNDFGMRLFQETSLAAADKNIFISPLSVTLALAMTYNGAAQATETEMRNVLGFPEMTRQELNISLAGLSSLLTGLDKKVNLQIANSIWYRMGLPIENDFVQRNQDFYDAQVRALDFNSALAPKTINDWISDKTQGRIQDVVKSIDADLMLFLINAIYFKGTWTFEFLPKDTRDDLFYRTPENPLPCKMMAQSTDLAYYENDLVQMVDLPYGDGQFAMAIILPKTTVTEVANAFTATNWQTWHNSMTNEPITLHLPKFKMNYDVLMNPMLQNMGMKLAFDPNQADFSDICKTLPLFISYVQHVSFVQVDEEGTEAAAVTVVGVGTTSAGGSNHRMVRVDKPFIFVIHDHHSHTALFIGKIFAPEWQ